MTTPNTELLRETLAHVEDNPDALQQHTYRCGTGMCFAGWRAELSGGQWVHGPDHGLSELLHAEPGDDPTHVALFNGIEVVHARDRAERLLGLNYEQADDLFGALNTIDDLRRIVAELCEGAGR